MRQRGHLAWGLRSTRLTLSENGRKAGGRHMTRTGKEAHGTKGGVTPRPAQTPQRTTARATHRRHRRGPFMRTPPLLLDASPWGTTLTESPGGGCDLIAMLAALALAEHRQQENQQHQNLLIVADTSMQARLLTCARRETGLGTLPVHTLDDLPVDLRGMSIMLVSVTSDDALRTMHHLCTAGAIPYCIVCNTGTKSSRFIADAIRGNYQILRLSADLILTLAGRPARWISPVRVLLPTVGEWQRVTSATLPSCHSLLVAPGPSQTVLVSSVDRWNATSLSVSLGVQLPGTMGLFLYECVGLDPYGVHEICHVQTLAVDLTDVNGRAEIAPLSEPGAHSQGLVKTVSLRQDRSAVSQYDSPPHGATEDSSRHYGDDQWYDTEAEKEAQDRRQGGKISYSDVGVKRQSARDYGITSEQMEQLRKRRGTPREDQ